MKRKILLCGAPTVGKSTAAKLLSEHFNLPWISTDQIRDIMRSIADPKQHTDLFNEGYETAESFLGAFSVSEIAEMEFTQGKAAWVGVRNFINNDYTWEDGFVIEGVNLVPELIAKDYANDSEVKTVVLVDRNIERMRKVIYERGLWGDANTYSDDVKEKEVEWASLYSNLLEEQAKKHGIPVIEVTKSSKEDLENIIKVVC